MALAIVTTIIKNPEGFTTKFLLFRLSYLSVSALKSKITKNKDMMKRNNLYKGGCHCGKIQFEVSIKKYEGIKCNCSICRKKGFLHLIVPSEDFKLIKGQDFLTTYTFNTKTAQHKFCKVCGIHSFYTPRSHPTSISVNIRCLDVDIIDKVKFTDFDGQNWEENISKIKN